MNVLQRIEYVALRMSGVSLQGANPMGSENLKPVAKRVYPNCCGSTLSIRSEVSHETGN